MPHHRPNAWDIARHKEHLLVISAEELVSHVQQTACYINPHEREMPLQRTTEPSADRKRFRPVNQIFLRDLRSKTRKRPKNLQSAPDQHKQRHRIDPMAKPHNERMLVNRFRHLAGFRIFDFNRVARHATSKLQTVKVRIALVFPVPGFVEHICYFQAGQIFRLLVSDLRRNL